VVDFETYYDDRYSLKSLATQEYVHSDKFHIHGVGVALIDLFSKSEIETYYFHNADLDGFKTILQTLKSEGRLYVICHNAIFEGNILAKLGYVPDLVIDTASMSRALLGNTQRRHSLDAVATRLLGYTKTDGLAATKGLQVLPPDIAHKLAEYCMRDVELTAKIARKLAPFFPTKEFVVCDMVSRMAYDNSIQLDAERIQNYYSTVVERKKTALVRAGIQDAKELRSRGKFAETLLKFGVVPPTKISPRTGKETYAFAKNDKEIKALLEHPNPDIQALVAAKLEASSTIEETRAARFVRLAQFSQLGVPYRYSGAVQTHRISGTDSLNMQNLPRGGGLRGAIRAPSGHSLVVSDLSQIELRITLAMAGHDDALDILRRGQDLYCWFASKMYGKDINEKDHPDERQVAKSAVLGCGFGMGAARFMEYASSMGVKITQSEADAIVASFRTTFGRIPKLWKNLERLFTQASTGSYDSIPVTFGFSDGPDRSCSESYGFTLPCGLRVQYPELQTGQTGMRFTTAMGTEHLFGGKITENLAQALARNVLFDKAYEIALIAREAKLSMTTHDELVYVVPNSVLEETAQAIDSVMNKSVEWWPSIPLASKTKYGLYYGDIK
jgi:DNA polymerase